MLFLRETGDGGRWREKREGWRSEIDISRGFESVSESRQIH